MLLQLIQRSYAANNGDHIVRLRRLLRKARRSLTRRSAAAADCVSALALPWTDIVRVFIDYKARKDDNSPLYCKLRNVIKSPKGRMYPCPICS